MARLQRYVEVYTDVIAPSHRAFADVNMHSRHLCDFSEQKAMATLFVLSGLDWSTTDPWQIGLTCKSCTPRPGLHC
jgi:hypothetical protein